MWEFLRHFDNFSIPFEFFIGQQSSLSGPKVFSHRFQSRIGGLLTITEKLITFAFLFYLVFNMYSGNADDYDTKKIFNDFQQDPVLNLTELRFLPNIELEIMSDSDLEAIKNITERDLDYRKSRKLLIDPKKLNKYVKFETSIRILNRNKGIDKRYLIPMVRCKKEWFEGTEYVETRICPDLDRIPKEVWTVKGSYSTQDDRISVAMIASACTGDPECKSEA